MDADYLERNTRPEWMREAFGSRSERVKAVMIIAQAIQVQIPGLIRQQTI